MTLRDTTPNYLIPGDTAKWQRSYTDYPASQGWVATYYLTGPAQRTVTGTASVDAFQFVLSALASSNLPKGTYSYAIKCALSGEVYTAESGLVEMRDNLALANPIQFCETMIGLLETALQTMLLDGEVAQTISVAGRSITLEKMADVEAMRSRYYKELKVLKSGGRPSALIGKSVLVPLGNGALNGGSPIWPFPY